MKPDNTSSGASSATTSPSEPAHPASAPQDPAVKNTPESKLSEAEFLKRQADDAKAAISQSLSDLTAKLRNGVDPLVWARQYPWISLGVAAAAGFVGTSMVVPSREQQALAKLAAIERAVNAKPADHHEQNGKPATSHESILKVILHEVFAILQPVVLSLITAGLTVRKTEEASAAHDGASK
jgi:hypothetical protein